MANEKIKPGDLLRKRREELQKKSGNDDKRKRVQDMLIKGMNAPVFTMEGTIPGMESGTELIKKVQDRERTDLTEDPTEKVKKLAITGELPGVVQKDRDLEIIAAEKKKELAGTINRQRQNILRTFEREAQTETGRNLDEQKKAEILGYVPWLDETPAEQLDKKVQSDSKREYIKRMFFKEQGIDPIEIEKRITDDPKLDELTAGQQIINERKEAEKEVIPGITEVYNDLAQNKPKDALDKVLKGGYLRTRALGRGFMDIPVGVVKAVTFLADPRFNMTKRAIDFGADKLTGLLGLKGRNTEFESKYTSFLDKSRDILTEYVDKIGPDMQKYKDDYLTKVSTGAGSVIGFMLTTALTRGMNLTPQVSAGLMGLLSQAGSMADDTYRKTGDIDKAYQMFLAGIPLGYSESLGLGGMLGNLDKLTGNSVKRIIAEGLKEGVEETLQEGFQSFGEAYADNLITGADRDPLKEALENITVAGPLGFIFPFGVGGVSKMYNKIKGQNKQLNTMPEPPQVDEKGKEVKPVEVDNEITPDEIQGLTEAMDELGIKTVEGEKQDKVKINRLYDAFKEKNAPKEQWIDARGEERSGYGNEAYSNKQDYWVKSDETKKWVRWGVELSDGKHVSLEGAIRITRPDDYAKFKEGLNAKNYSQKLWKVLSNDEKQVIFDTMKEDLPKLVPGEVTDYGKLIYDKTFEKNVVNYLKESDNPLKGVLLANNNQISDTFWTWMDKPIRDYMKNAPLPTEQEGMTEKPVKTPAKEQKGKGISDKVVTNDVTKTEKGNEFKKAKETGAMVSPLSTSYKPYKNVVEIDGEIYGYDNRGGGDLAIWDKDLQAWQNPPEGISVENNQIVFKTGVKKESPELQKAIDAEAKKRVEEHKELNLRGEYTVEQAAEHSRKVVDTVQKLADEKDYGKLVEWMHQGNKYSKKLFGILTGEKLPSTDKGTEEVLRKYVGEENYKKHLNAQAENKKLRAAEKIESDKKAVIRAMEDKKYRTASGKIQTAKEWIESKMAEGYTKIVSRKSGFSVKYRIEKVGDPNQSSYDITANEKRYVEMVLEEKKAEKQEVKKKDYLEGLKYSVKKLTSGTYKGDYMATVTEGEHKGVIGTPSVTKEGAIQQLGVTMEERITSREKPSKTEEEVRYPKTKAAARSEATGILSGGPVSYVEERGYEFIPGELVKGDYAYNKLVGFIAGGKAERLLGTGITIQKKEDKSLGLNNEGKQLFEDKNGVRYVTDGMVRISESVSLTPTGSYVNESQREDRYKTQEELQKNKPSKISEIVKESEGRINIVRPATGKQAKVQDDIDDLEARILKKLGGQLTAGLDPEVLMMSTQLIGKYIQREVYKLKDILNEVYAKYGKENFEKFFPALKTGYNAYVTNEEDEDILGKMDDMADVKGLKLEQYYSDTKKNLTDEKNVSNLGKGDQKNETENNTGTGTEGSAGRKGSEGDGKLRERDDQGRVIDEPDGRIGDGEGKETSTGGDEGTVPVSKPDSKRDSKSDELSKPAGKMGGLGATGSNGGGISKTSQDNVVSDADGEGTRNYDLRESEPVRLSIAGRQLVNEKVKKILARNPKPSELTDEERDLLTQYTGEGGLKAASKEALTQFYTDYEVIRAIYNALDKSGFKYKTGLEPGVGIGNFVGMKPFIKWDTVDIDPVNIQITKLLYPEATHYNNSYEQFINNGYDLVISNVPFLETRGAGGMDVRPDIKMLHDFYFAHSLDRVKDNGIIAFVTGKGTMDRQDDRIRQEIVSKADVIGAFRLPSTAFEKNTQTSVITDIIFLQKRPAGVPARSGADIANALFTASTKTKDDIYLNRLYQEYPRLILGDMKAGINKAYGSVAYEITGEPQLENLVLPNKYKPYVQTLEEQEQADELPTNKEGLIPDKFAEWGDYAHNRKLTYVSDLEDPDTFNRNFFKSEKDELFYVPDVEFATSHFGGKKNYEGLKTGVVAFRDVDTKVKIFKKLDNPVIYKKAAILQYLKETASLIQDGDSTDRSMLIKNHIDEYKAEFGKHPLNDKDLKKFFYDLDEKSTYLEYTTFFNQKWEPAPVFSKQTRFTGSGTLKITKDSPLRERALYNEDIKGVIELKDAVLLNADDMKELLKNGYAYLGKGRVQNNILYYSGRIYDKIDEATSLLNDTTDEGLRVLINEQIDGLEAIKPTPKRMDEIDIKGNEGWFKPFVSEAIPGMRVETDPETKKSEYRSGLGEIYDNYLNNNQLVSLTQTIDKVQYALPEHVRKEEIAKAEARVKEIKLEIKENIRNNPALYEKILYAYNSKYKSYAKPDYTKASYIIEEYLKELPKETLAGSPFGLRKNQTEWVVKALYEGKGINAHDVGGGKTYAAIFLAHVLKAKKIANKPVFAVPAKTITKWERDIKFMYPDAKIVNLGNLPADKRVSQLFEVANNEADFVLISHEGFTQIKLSLKDELKYFEQIVKDSLEGDSTATERQKEVMREKINGYKQVLRKTKRDPNLTFDKLGFDAIITDEAHAFKNVGISADLVKFGAGTPFEVKKAKSELVVIDGKEKMKRTEASLQSARSYDFRFKAKLIAENNNNKNIFLLTATPTPNKPMEVFTMLRHLSDQLLDEYDIYTDADFANNFLHFGSVNNPQNKKGFDNIVTKIVNAQELRMILDRFVDKLSMEQMPWIKLPEAVIVKHIVKQSSGMVDIAKDILNRMRRIAMRGGKIFPGMDTIIAVYTGGRSAGVDPRLYGGQHAGVNISHRTKQLETDKIEMVVDLASKQYKGNKNAGQIIFLDPAGHTQVAEGKLRENLHREIKAELMKKGFKAEQIAIISGQEITNPETGKERKLSGDKMNAAKQEVVDAYNAGKVKIIIGTTKSAGEGMDIQVKTTDIYHMDIPYTPGEFIQRNGRGVRFGNENDVVRLHYFFTQGSFDALSFNIVARKRGWNQAIWDKDVANEIDTVSEMLGGMPSEQEIMLEMETNPFRRRILELEIQRDRLVKDRSNLRETATMYRNELNYTVKSLADYERYLADHIEDREKENAKLAKVPEGKKHDDKRNDIKRSRDYETRQIGYYRQKIKDHPIHVARLQETLKKAEENYQAAEVDINSFISEYIGEGESVYGQIITPKAQLDKIIADNNLSEEEADLLMDPDKAARLEEEEAGIVQDAIWKHKANKENYRIDKVEADTVNLVKVSDPNKKGKVTKADLMKDMTLFAKPEGPSYMKDRGMVQTDTPEFKKWFGDSKVVDKNGKPLVVYHGTAADFTEFKGMSWFSETPDLANNYAVARATTIEGNVLPVYLSIKKPLYFQANQNTNVNPKYFGRLLGIKLSNETKKVIAATLEEYQAASGVRDLTGRARIPAYKILYLPAIIQQIQDAGYDGLYAREDKHDTWAVLNPEQIKSATGNSGAFDPNNPDIRFSKDTAKPTASSEIVKAAVTRLNKFITNGEVTYTDNAGMLKLQRENGNNDAVAHIAFALPGTSKVYINLDKANAEAPIHEFGHLFGALIRSEKPGFWAEGKKIIRTAPKDLIDYVKTGYPGLSEDAMLDEVLMQAVGSDGKILWDEQNRTLYNRFKAWLQRFWDKVKIVLNEKFPLSRAFGPTKAGKLNIEKLDMNTATFKDLSMAIAGDLLRGNRIVFEAEVNEAMDYFGLSPASGVSKVSPAAQYEKGKFADVFYSQLERVAGEKVPATATKQMVMNILDSQEIKKEEVEWLGIKEWLNAKYQNPNDKVKKQDLMDFIAQNKVVIEEKELGASQWQGDNLIDNGQAVATLVDNEDGTWSYTSDFSEGEERFGDREEAMREAESNTVGDIYSKTAPRNTQWQLPGGVNPREIILSMPSVDFTTDETHYGDIKGTVAWVRVNDRYVDIPSTSEIEAIGKKMAKFLSKQAGREIKVSSLGSGAPESAVKAGIITEEEAKQFSRTKDFLNDYSDRNTPPGLKMLFLEEVQSKIHQLGRKQGYKQNYTELPEGSTTITEKAKLPGITKLPENAFVQRFGVDEPFLLYIDHNKFVGHINDVKTKEEATKEAVRMLSKDRYQIKLPNGDLSKLTYKIEDTKKHALEILNSENNGVPDAPFKKTWHELVMKRMIRYAAENGYDAVGWTTGEQQNERYDLSNQVEEIQYDSLGKNAKGETVNKYFIYVKPKGESGFKNLGEFEENKLADVVGKELAEKMINGEGKENSEGTLSFTGLDLKIGGEGMKGFYDRMIPSFVNKYAKKWGGKVVDGRIDANDRKYRIGSYGKGYAVFETGDNNPIKWFDTHSGAEEYIKKFPLEKTAIHRLDITPEMANSVLYGGQALFQKANNKEQITNSEAFKKWFGKSKVVDSAGKPLVVYHGTTNTFDSFTKFGYNYFTDNPEYADLFATSDMLNTKDKGNSQVYPVYLSIKNPLDLTKYGIERYNADYLLMLLEQNGYFNSDVYERLSKVDNSLEMTIWGWFREYIDKEDIKKSEFDGVVLQESAFGSPIIATAYLTLDNTQIKSATGNNGEFDAGNPDIRFMKDPNEKGPKGNNPASGIYVRKNKTISDKVFENNLDKLGKIGAKILIDEKTKTPRGTGGQAAPATGKKTFKKTVNELFSNEGNKKPFVLSEEQTDKLYEASMRLMGQLERDKVNKEREFQKRTAKTIGKHLSESGFEGATTYEKIMDVVGTVSDAITLKQLDEWFARTIGKKIWDKISGTAMKPRFMNKLFEQFANVPDRETFKKLWKEMENNVNEYKRLAKETANNLYYQDLKTRNPLPFVSQRMLEMIIRGSEPADGKITIQPNEKNGLKEPLIVDMKDLKDRAKRVKELNTEMKKLGELYDVLPIETYNSKLPRKRIAWLLKFKTELEMLKDTADSGMISGNGFSIEWQNAKGETSTLKFRNAAEIQERIDSTDKTIKNNFTKGGEGYFKRVYVSKELEKSLNKYGIIKPTKLDLTSAMHRKDIPLEVRVKMGEVLTAAYPVAKSIMLEGKDISIGRFFEAISEKPDWSSYQAVEGWQMVPDSKKYGKLRNMWVHPDVWKQLNDTLKLTSPEWIEKFSKELMGTWKAIKVPMNPPTVGRNIMSEMIKQDLSGTSFTDQAKFLPRALGNLRKFSKGEKTEIDDVIANFIGTTFTNQELTQFLTDYDDIAADTPGFMELSVPDMFLKVYRKATLVDTMVGRKAIAFYQGTDVTFKLVRFLHEMDKYESAEKKRAKGKTVQGVPTGYTEARENAVNEANKWVFDYGSVPLWVRKTRESWWGLPFFTWSYLAAPRMIEAAIRHPISFWKYPLIFSAWTAYALASLGMTDDEWEEIRKDLPGRILRGQFILIPWRDSKGQIQMLDLSYILPYGFMYNIGLAATTLFTEGEMPDSETITEGLLQMMGNPFFTTAAEIGTNYNRYSQRKIWEDADSPAEKYQKQADYMIKLWMPSFTPEIPFTDIRGGYVYDKLRSAITGRPDYYGRVFDIGPAIGSAIFGFKTTPIDPDKLVDDQIKRREGMILDLQQKKGQLIKDDSIDRDERLKRAGEIDEKVNKLKQEIGDYEERSTPGTPEAMLLDRYIKNLERQKQTKPDKVPELQAEINRLKVDLDVLKQEKYNKDQPGLQDIKAKVLKGFNFDKMVPVMKSEIEKDLDRGSDERITRNRELLDYLRKNENVPAKSRKEFDDMYKNYDKMLNFKKDINKINDVMSKVGITQSDGKAYNYKPAEYEELGYSVSLDRAIVLLQGGYMPEKRYKTSDGKTKTSERRKVGGMMEKIDEEYKKGKITAEERKMKKEKVREAVTNLKEMK